MNNILKNREKILNLLGPQCKRCGYSTDKRALCIDHVQGDGHRERALYKGAKYWTKILAEIEEGTDRYQVLCCNCNFLKLRDEDGPKWRESQAYGRYHMYMKSQLEYVSPECTIGAKILELLPARKGEIIPVLSRTYATSWVRRAIRYLLDSHQMVATSSGEFQKI